MGSSTKKLLGSSTIVFVGTMIASAFAYLFNMIMGRMLGPSQYGEMTAILSLLVILSVGSGAVLTVVMRYAGELFAVGNLRAINRLRQVFNRQLFYVALCLFVAGWLISPQITRFLSIEHTTPVILALASFFFGFLIVVIRGILQGTQQFVPLSVSSIIESLGRLVVGVLLVKIGWSVNGAIGAVLIATVIAYIYTLWPVRRLLAKDDSARQSFSFNKREILAYAAPTLLSSILLAVALNVDVILVKHYFPAEEAGLYAAISTIAKIVTYATAPVLSVMFPMISEHRAKGSKHFKIFLLSLLLTVIGSLLILVIYTVAPGKVITLLYGESYTGLYYLLPQVGLVVLFYSLVAFMASYYQAIKDFFYIWPFVIVIVGNIIAIELYHPNIGEVVRVMTISLGLLFAILFCYYLYTKRLQLSAILQNNYAFNED